MSNTEDKSVKSTVLLILRIFSTHKDWRLLMQAQGFSLHTQCKEDCFLHLLYKVFSTSSLSYEFLDRRQKILNILGINGLFARSPLVQDIQKVWTIAAFPWGFPVL